MFLVLIETSGNQNYIFSTNKLKENVGASELTYYAGTIWVLEALEIVSKSNILRNGQQLRDNLLDPTVNPRIETENDVKVEVIVATSGKALLLTKERKVAKEIIQYVTYKALKDSPGLDICGVIHEFDWEKDTLGEVNFKIHQKFATVRSQKPSPDLRFMRLPMIDECSTSGLPASQLDTYKQDAQDTSVLRSEVSCSKRQYSSKGFIRIQDFLNRKNTNIKLARSLRYLDEELKERGLSDDFQEGLNYEEKLNRQLEWLAVVHADGNGLGEIFLNFGKYIKSNRDYVDQYRKFSIALDQCTEQAFLSSLKIFESENDGLIPVIPLILGGDDLTALCDGKFAIKFTHEFLLNFEKETQSQEHLDGIIPQIAKQALGVERLSACAGIAIIKRKFPFSVAYELSEKLMQSAKEVKVKVTYSETNKPYPCSAFDFHVLHDSSNVDFKSIRSKLELKNQKLYNRPYVVTNEDKLQETQGLEWARFHQFYKLEEKVKVLVAKDEEDNLLPNNQIHDLRAGLFLGKTIADARYLLIRDRYRHQGIIILAGSENSLFQKEPDSGIDITGLLDAMDAAEFLNLEEKSDEQKA
jgi:hypothetical protein